MAFFQFIENGADVGHFLLLAGLKVLVRNLSRSFDRASIDYGMALCARSKRARMASNSESAAISGLA
ncbi:MAG: hypothetical protein R3E55_11820 [Burkholderiaceae bacterium]